MVFSGAWLLLSPPRMPWTDPHPEPRPDFQGADPPSLSTDIGKPSFSRRFTVKTCHI